MKLSLLLLVLTVACGSSETRTDASTDASPSPDVEANDAGPDADPADAGPDAPAADVGPDATDPDMGPADAGPDMPSDAGDDAADTGPVPTRHRAERTECDHERPAPDVSPPPRGGCTSHSMCEDPTRGENGRCTPGGRGFNSCTYDQCFNDDGCGATSACICEGSSRSDANVCMGGDCQIDADCGDNGFCSPSFGDCGAFSGVVAYFCHTLEDECLNDDECEKDCRFTDDVGHWYCGISECAG